MQRSILVTGGSGFLGTRLLGRLAGTSGRVVCLGRRRPAGPAKIGFVSGDLLDRNACRRALDDCDTVLHLASATGRNSRVEYFRVNRGGTQVILEQAQEAGIKQFLYVSTIAVKFPNTLHYHYADSKRQAEALVRESRVNWTIVRPTMIFGRGSTVQDGLRRLATLPIMPVFGNGLVPVQPVFVDDVADVIAGILEAGGFGGRTIEIGGPEVLTMGDLLVTMRFAAGVRNTRMIHLPARPIAASLAALEPFLRPLLPVTAGQLSSFLNSGTAEPDPSISAWRARMRNIKEML